MDQNNIAGLTARAVVSLLAGVCWEERVSKKRVYCCVHRMNWLKQEFGGREEEKFLCPMIQLVQIWLSLHQGIVRRW